MSQQPRLDLGDRPIEDIALDLWREQQMRFPAFVRRIVPDDMDHATGAWERCLRAAERGDKSC